MFDCHNHSNFSGDSKMDAYSAVEKAKNLGLIGIAFTDHVDYDYPKTCEEIFDLDLNEYNKYMDKLIDYHGDSFKILKGLEVGLQTHVLEDAQKLVNSNNYDIIIGSIHVIDKLELHNGDFCKYKTKIEAYTKFLDVTVEILTKFHDFDIIGHIDIIRRYGNFADKDLRYVDYKDSIDAILKLLVMGNKGIEINTSGFRYGLDSPMPSFEILKRFKEVGGEIVTIASDSHCLEHIGYKFEIAKEMAKVAGFKYLAYFNKRKPEFYNI